MCSAEILVGATSYLTINKMQELQSDENKNSH